MEDTATLQIRVTSDEVAKATDRLNTMGRAGVTADNSIKNLTATTNNYTNAISGAAGSIGRMVFAFISLSSAIAAIHQVVKVEKIFETLEAQLRTVTGSSEVAARALDALKDFAPTTIFDLKEVTAAFIELVSRGLEPSERALHSYGNIAAFTGKEIAEVANVVADATVGLFKPLNNLGIKARADGENITFIFRGAATTIKNSSQEIQNYLIGLGETAFSTGMEDQANTLSELLTNLNESYETTVHAIAQAGLGDVIKSAVVTATNALEDFRKAIESGQLGATLDAQFKRFQPWAEDAKTSIRLITDFLDDDTSLWKGYVQDFIDVATDSFKHWPENIRGAVQLIGNQIESEFARSKNMAGAFFDLASVAGKTFGSTLKSLWDIGNSSDLGEQIGLYKNLFGTVSTGYKDAKTVASDFLLKQLEINQAQSARTDEIFEENDAARAAYDEQIKNADILRENYDLLAESVAVLTRLEKENADAGRAARPDRLKEIIPAVPEEETVDERLKKRLETVRNYLGNEQELFLNYSGTQEETELNAWDRRQTILEEALDKRQLSEEEFHNLSKENEVAYQNSIAQLQIDNARRAKAMTTVVMQSGLSTAQNAADFIVQITEKGSAAQIAAFALSKALAVGQAIINTALAVTAATALGPAGLALVPAIEALGASQVALIIAQSIYGAKQMDGGGDIPFGGMAIVGERGPELVHGPAHVTSRESTAAMMGRSAPVFVEINNYSGEKVEVQETDTSEGKKLAIFIGKAKQAITADIQNGGNQLSNTIERAWGLKRGLA